jgi:UDP-glucose 4-epimerase
MKTIVTGGSGFIGSNLVDRLIADGHEVTVIDKVAPSETNKNDRASYVVMNILDKKVEDVFAEVKPKLLYHLAAYIDDRASVREPDVCTDTNVMGTLNVLEAARKSGVKRIIFTSTSVYYGAQEVMPIPETATPRPITPYAVSKLIGEQYLRYYREHFGISSMALRLANVYGPRQAGSKECGAIAIFTDRLLSNRDVYSHNDGLTTRDYIFVGDVVEALSKAGESEYIGVVNCSTGVGTTTGELYVMVADAIGSDRTPLVKPEVLDHPKHVILDPALAKKELGFEAKMGLKEGIAQTVEWYKMHRV